jgi:hypothetical protein
MCVGVEGGGRERGGREEGPHPVVQISTSISEEEVLLLSTPAHTLVA